MLMPSSIKDKTHSVMRTVAIGNNDDYGVGSQGLGQSSDDFGTMLTNGFQSLVSALPDIAKLGITAYSGIVQAQTLAQRGIYPTSYSANGTPVYTATPSGVTPSNPYSLPSGYGISNGVTPTQYQTPLLASLGISSDMTLPLLLGGGALLAILLLKGR